MRPLLAGFLLAACVPHPAPRALAPDAAPTRPSTATTTAARTSAPLVAAAPPATDPSLLASSNPSAAEATDLLGDPDAATGALPAFEIEPPYPPGRRPARPTGAVAASVADEELARWNLGGNGDPAHPSNRSGYHPAVRVTVDTKPLRPIPERSASRDVLTAPRLLARARSVGYWPFRTCFEALLRRTPDAKGGTTRVRISIAPSGRVTAARSLTSDLTDPDAVRCIRDAARSLRFSPAPARRLDVDLSVELWPGDAPLPPLATDGEPRPFDARALAARIDARASDLARCYAEGVARDPRLWGRIALRISVGTDGAVHHIREDESRFPDPDVVACLSRELRRLDPIPATQPFDAIVAFRCGAPNP